MNITGHSWQTQIITTVWDEFFFTFQHSLEFRTHSAESVSLSLTPIYKESKLTVVLEDIAGNSSTGNSRRRINAEVIVKTIGSILVTHIEYVARASTVEEAIPVCSTVHPLLQGSQPDSP